MNPLSYTSMSLIDLGEVSYPLMTKWFLPYSNMAWTIYETAANSPLVSR